jgi:D-serine deaminase-like pyridoxal phosphate-dependent protein
VDVGCFRCGCPPAQAAEVADFARAEGLEVRGVMGYEGHLMMVPVATKAAKVAEAMVPLVQAHGEVGGDIVSGGGTGTYHLNRWVTEVQAGSFTLMDSDYGKAGLPFRQALLLRLTVVSVNPAGWAVGDGGLKALGMDHGNPEVVDHAILYFADEHTIFAPAEGRALPQVGERISVVPSHVDPTVAYHERMYVIRHNTVIDIWPVDLRNW